MVMSLLRGANLLTAGVDIAVILVIKDEIRSGECAIAAGRFIKHANMLLDAFSSTSQARLAPSPHAVSAAITTARRSTPISHLSAAQPGLSGGGAQRWPIAFTISSRQTG